MRIIPIALTTGALALTAVGVIACGGEETTPEPTPAPAAAIEVQALDLPFRYEPTELTVAAGEPVTIRLINGGTVEHDFTIDDPGFQLAVAVGETAEGTLTDLAAGTYQFYCTVPGHKENGMTGQLVVTG
jgi:uncharacterized cupredoxin-like copper-binding protein